MRLITAFSPGFANMRAHLMGAAPHLVNHRELLFGWKGFGHLKNPHRCIHCGLIDSEISVALDSFLHRTPVFRIAFYRASLAPLPLAVFSPSLPRLLAPSPSRPIAPSLFFRRPDSSLFLRLVYDFLCDQRRHFGVVIKLHRVRAPRAGDRVECRLV